ncbi:MAG: DtxR family transcriptional regulator [Limisphaera sp.]|nr:DtxR family transcriptional regulator [Limisphaera sp.]
MLIAVWPRQGVVARWCRARRLASRARREDALKHILKTEANGREATLESVSGALQLSPRKTAGLLAELESGGLIHFEGGRMQLSDQGRELATHVVRAHRLWESYLAEQTGLTEEQWHRQAERQEHLLSRQQAEALAAQLGHPRIDPHGDTIPEPGDTLPADRGSSLNSLQPDAPAVITHVEDEPQTLYARLTREGLRPGVKVCILERTPNMVRLWGHGREHLLSPLEAQSIGVEPLKGLSLKELQSQVFLHRLQPGQTARIVELSPACRGMERRRLLDLGFVPGTVVTVDMASPMGDPRAYRVRGTTVALRHDQARWIRVEPLASSVP